MPYPSRCFYDIIGCKDEREEDVLHSPSVMDVLDRNIEINKTFTVSRAISHASKNKRKFIKFVEANIKYPWAKKRVVLLSVYLDSKAVSRLETLRESINRTLGFRISLSKTLSFVLYYYSITSHRTPTGIRITTKELHSILDP